MGTVQLHYIYKSEGEIRTQLTLAIIAKFEYLVVPSLKEPTTIARSGNTMPKIDMNIIVD